MIKISKFLFSSVQLHQIGDFQEAQQLNTSQKYQLAAEKYQRVINILEQTQQTQNPIYTQSLTYAAKNLQNTSNYKQLHEIFFKLFTHTNQDTFIHNALSYSFYHDLDQSTRYLSFIEKNPYYLFYKGTLQLFENKPQNALENLKLFINDCDKNQYHIQWQAFHNLGVSIWKNEYPSFNNLNVSGNIQEGLKQGLEAAYMFKKALILQNNNNKDIQLLNEQNMLPNIPNLILHQQSIDTLRSLCDYLLDCHLEKRAEHTYWSKIFLKNQEIHNKKQVYKALINIAHHSSLSDMYLKSEGLFNTILSMLQNEQSMEKNICENFYGKLIQKIDKREEEGQQIIRKTQQKYNEDDGINKQWLFYICTNKFILQ